MFYRWRPVAALVSSGLILASGAALALRQTSYVPAGVGVVPPVSGLGLPLPTSFGPSAADVTRVAAPTDAAAVLRPSPLLPPAAQAPGAPPTRVVLSAEGINVVVDPVGVSPAGELNIPADIHRVGWWDGGAEPGSAHGTVVIAGHVDSAVAGQGALFHLERAAPGDRIQLSTQSGEKDYVVAARRSYVKSQLPASVFDRSGRPRLALITCGGPFDKATGSYADNVVIYAVPV